MCEQLCLSLSHTNSTKPCLVIANWMDDHRWSKDKRPYNTGRLVTVIIVINFIFHLWCGNFRPKLMWCRVNGQGTLTTTQKKKSMIAIALTVFAPQHDIKTNRIQSLWSNTTWWFICGPSLREKFVIYFNYQSFVLPQTSWQTEILWKYF